MLKNRNRTCTYAICLTVLFLTACSLGASAKITDMVAGISQNMDRLDCWLTLEFKKPLKKGDGKDVKVRFSSLALRNGSESFDWKFIAKKDVISKGFMKGFDPNPKSDYKKDPPLNTPIRILFPLKAKTRIDLAPGDVINLKAEFFWGGKLQDSAERTIEHAYRRQ